MLEVKLTNKHSGSKVEFMFLEQGDAENVPVLKRCFGPGIVRILHDAVTDELDVRETEPCNPAMLGSFITVLTDGNWEQDKA